jgi:hypothetical protein
MDGRAISGAGGLVILSIDLELEIGHHDLRHESRLDEVRNHLVRLTQQHGLPATWAVADPLLSAASEPVLAAGVGHELAVLGDRSWIGCGAGRTRLARELTRRFISPRKAGMPVTTLALRNVEQVPDFDLLLDHGVTALRNPAVDSARLARKSATPPMRYGVWQAPTAWCIPPRPGWWTSLAWQIQRQIRRTARCGGTLHLEIDAPRLVESGPDALAAIDSTLTRIAAYRNAGRLDVKSLGQLAQEWHRSHVTTPTRSILRAA